MGCGLTTVLGSWFPVCILQCGYLRTGSFPVSHSQENLRINFRLPRKMGALTSPKRGGVPFCLLGRQRALVPSDLRVSRVRPATHQADSSHPAGRPHTRSTVITAVKFLISDQPHPIDPLLKSLIGEHPFSLPPAPFSTPSQPLSLS